MKEEAIEALEAIRAELRELAVRRLADPALGRARGGRRRRSSRVVVAFASVPRERVVDGYVLFVGGPAPARARPRDARRRGDDGASARSTSARCAGASGLPRGRASSPSSSARSSLAAATLVRPPHPPAAACSARSPRTGSRRGAGSTLDAASPEAARVARRRALGARPARPRAARRPLRARASRSRACAPSLDAA